jgi:hypothetical protein
MLSFNVSTLYFWVLLGLFSGQCDLDGQPPDSFRNLVFLPELSSAIGLQLDSLGLHELNHQRHQLLLAHELELLFVFFD